MPQAARAVHCFRTSCLSELRTHKLSPSQTLEFVRNEKNLSRACETMYRAPYHPLIKFVAPTLASTMYYLCSQQDRHLADVTFEKLAEGINLTREDPARLLRNLLVAESRMDRKDRRARSQQYAYWFEAWDAIKNDTPLKRLEYANQRTYNTFEFPTIGKVPK